MLVLSRKVGERIRIGDDIRITVVRISQGIARIGIEAPDSTGIAREELLELDDVAIPQELAIPVQPAA